MRFERQPARLPRRQALTRGPVHAVRTNRGRGGGGPRPWNGHVRTTSPCRRRGDHCRRRRRWHPRGNDGRASSRQGHERRAAAGRRGQHTAAGAHARPGSHSHRDPPELLLPCPLHPNDRPRLQSIRSARTGRSGPTDRSARRGPVGPTAPLASTDVSAPAAPPPIRSVRTTARPERPPRPQRSPRPQRDPLTRRDAWLGPRCPEGVCPLTSWCCRGAVACGRLPPRMHRVLHIAGVVDDSGTTRNCGTGQ